jgi:hypothetical protein
MLLTEKQLKDMEFNKFYAIYREPGAGKTYTARNLILPYCKEQGWKVLFLTHRNTLKAQIKYDLEDFIKESPDTITVMNYQAIESLVRKLDVEAVQKYLCYQFIICDEAHYFVSDAWNKQSHLSMSFLRYSSAIKLFLTGTPKPLENLNKMLDIRIFDKPDRSIHNLDELLFFKNIETFDKHFDSLLKEKNNKALLFYGNGHHAWNDVENKYKNSAFVCSETHELGEHRNKEELNHIIENTKFNSKVLCTTSTLEAGVNIEDDNVKLVASIRPYSVHGIVQQFARIRKSKIIGAVVEPHYQAITSWKADAEKELELINHIKNSCGVSEYMKINRLNFNSENCPAWITAKIDFNEAFVTISIEINELYIMKLKDTIWQCKFILEHGYLKLLSQYYEGVKVVDVEKQIANNELIEYLDYLTNAKMFDEEQKQFINTLMEVYKFRSKDKRKKLGLKRINDILKDKDIGFRIENPRTRINGKQIRYWSVTKNNTVVYIQPCANLSQNETVIENSKKENLLVKEEKKTKNKITFKELIKAHEFMKVQEVTENNEEEAEEVEFEIVKEPFTGRLEVFNEKTQKMEKYIETEWINGEKVEIYIVPDVPQFKRNGKNLALEAMLGSVI